MPTEEDLCRLIYALSDHCGLLESRRIAKGVKKLIDGKTVDEVLREDLEIVS